MVDLVLNLIVVSHGPLQWAPGALVIMEGGSWICDKCYTDLPNRITSILANNCDEFNNWPR